MNYGRRIIYSDATAITIENVVEEVRKAAVVHDGNANDILYLVSERSPSHGYNLLSTE